MQEARFTAGDLADIAHELDDKEREHMLAEGITPDALRYVLVRLKRQISGIRERFLALTTMAGKSFRVVRKF